MVFYSFYFEFSQIGQFGAGFSNPFESLFPLLAGQDQKKENAVTTVPHVTIKQLVKIVTTMNHNTKEIKFGGKPFRYFCLVGRVASAQIEPQFQRRYDIIIEDSTATMPIALYCTNEKGFPGGAKHINFS